MASFGVSAYLTKGLSHLPVFSFSSVFPWDGPKDIPGKGARSWGCTWSFPGYTRPARKLEPGAEWPRISLCLITHLRVNNSRDAGSRPRADNSFALPSWANNRDPEAREGKEGERTGACVVPTVFGLTINITTKQGVERWTNQNITASVSQRVGTLLAKQTRRKEELTMNVKIPITVLEEFLRRNQALLPTSWSGGTTVSDPSVEVLFRLVTKTACVIYIQQWTLAPCQQGKVRERN